MSAGTRFAPGMGVAIDPYWKNVEFLFQNAGAAGNTSFVDRSKNNYALTTASPASATASSPRFGWNGVALTGTASIQTADMQNCWVAGTPFTFDVVFVRTSAAAGFIATLWTGAGTSWTAYDNNGPQWALYTNSTKLWLGHRTYDVATSSNSYIEIGLTLPAVGALCYARVVHDAAASRITLLLNGQTTTSPYPTSRFASSGLSRLSLGRCPGGGSAYSGDAAAPVILHAARFTRGIRRPAWGGDSTLPFPAHSGNAAPGVTPPPASGQAAITGSSWTVPAGITNISAVCIGRRMKVNGATVLQAQNGARIGDGGGDGGNPGQERSYVETTYSDSGGSFGGGGSTAIHTTYYLHGGGGGAGGYGANGGDGGNPPQAVTLGAGRGGTDSTSYASSGITPATPGQGASLRGLAGGGTLYGGGSANTSASSASPSERGNALAWKNAIAVSAGDTITFEGCGVAGVTVGSRIIWGAGRSFPENAGDV